MLMPIKVFRTIHSLVKKEITRLHNVVDADYECSPDLFDFSQDRRKALHSLKEWHRINKEFVKALRFDAQYADLSDLIREFLNINLSDPDKQRLLVLVRNSIEVGGNVYDCYSNINRYWALAEYKCIMSGHYELAVNNGTLAGKFHFVGYNLALNGYRKQLKEVRKLENAVKFLKKELRPVKPPKSRKFSKKVKGFLWQITH